MLTKLLFLKIPDKVITFFFALLGSAILVIIFSFHSGSLTDFIQTLVNTPLYFMATYLWLKAVIVDLVRIETGEKLTMPGFTFWAYGLSFFAFWIIKDTVHSPSLFGKTDLEKYLYFQNPDLFWAALEVSTSLLLLPVRKLTSSVKTVESFLVLDILRSVTLFLVFGLFDTLITTLS